MNSTEVARARAPLWGIVGLLAFIGVIVAVDLAGDYGAGAGWAHIALEGTILGGALIGIGLLLRQLGVLRRRSADLRDDLLVSQRDAARWRAEAQDLLSGLSQAIDRQFDRWELSPAEREVALLLLKGLSHKAIAEVRGVSDRTVRQQAHAVYAKGGLEGRADLAAFFLEDLLLPAEPTEHARRLDAEDLSARTLQQPPG